MGVKYGLVRNSCMNPEVHGGYVLHKSYEGSARNMPQNRDPVWLFLFTLYVMIVFKGYKNYFVFRNSRSLLGHTSFCCLKSFVVLTIGLQACWLSNYQWSRNILLNVYNLTKEFEMSKCNLSPWTLFRHWLIQLRFSKENKRLC